MAVSAVNMCAAWPLLGWNCDRRFAGSEHHSTIRLDVQGGLRPSVHTLEPDHPRLPQLRRVGASVHRSDSTAHLLIETTSGHVDVLRLDPQLAPPRFQRPSLGCRPERRTHPRASHRRVHTDVGHPYALGADRGDVSGIVGESQQRTNDRISAERNQSEPAFQAVPCRQQVEGVFQSVVVLDPRRWLANDLERTPSEHGPLADDEARRETAIGRDGGGRTSFDAQYDALLDGAVEQEGHAKPRRAGLPTARQD